MSDVYCSVHKSNNCMLLSSSARIPKAARTLELSAEQMVKHRTHGQIFLDKLFSANLMPRLARVYANRVYVCSLVLVEKLARQLSNN